jgi:hypothetical protein
MLDMAETGYVSAERVRAAAGRLAELRTRLRRDVLAAALPDAAGFAGPVLGAERWIRTRHDQPTRAGHGQRDASAEHRESGRNPENHPTHRRRWPGKTRRGRSWFSRCINPVLSRRGARGR